MVDIVLEALNARELDHLAADEVTEVYWINDLGTTVDLSSAVMSNHVNVEIHKHMLDHPNHPHEPDCEQRLTSVLFARIL